MGGNGDERESVCERETLIKARERRRKAAHLIPGHLAP